jgi:hypothetical protein
MRSPAASPQGGAAMADNSWLDQGLDRQFKIKPYYTFSEFGCFARILNPEYDPYIRPLSEGLADWIVTLAKLSEPLMRTNDAKPLLMALREHVGDIAGEVALTLIEIQKVWPLRSRAPASMEKEKPRE